MYLKLYLKLNKIERLLHQENLQTTRLYGPLSDVAHGQGRILAYLKENEPLTVKELAELMEIRPQSLNDHLRRMERDGLIYRAQSPEDKRSVLIYLTPKAEELDIDYKSYENIFEGLTREELDELNRLLEKVEDNLEKELEDDVIVVTPPEPPRPRGPRPPKPERKHEPRGPKEIIPGVTFGVVPPPEMEGLPTEEPRYSVEVTTGEIEESVIKKNEELRDYVIGIVSEMLESFKKEGLAMSEEQSDEDDNTESEE